MKQFPKLGFHDSDLTVLQYSSGELLLRFEGVQDFRSKYQQSDFELTFFGVRQIYIDNLPALSLEMESPDADAYRLDISEHEVDMFIYLEWYEPRRTLPRSIKFTFDSVLLKYLGRNEYDVDDDELDTTE